MKKILVIGSVAADVIIRIPRLPKTQEDIHIQSQTLSLGGCAGNVALILQALQVPYDLFAPIGQGIYGDFVFQQLQKRKMHSLIPRCEEANGCCYCMVEAHGERTFLSDHGAEYRFRKEWFSLLEPQKYDATYVCGLELEETSGDLLLSYLQKAKPPLLFFAPGPRITKIAKERMEQMLALSCILHCNEQEILAYTQAQDAMAAMRSLYEQSKQPIILTQGAQGCTIYDGAFHKIPAPQTMVKDTIGAGDTHIASIMAALSWGCELIQAGIIANQASACVIQHAGVEFNEQDIQTIKQLM